MFRDLFRRFKLDLLVVTLITLVTFLLAVFAHTELKPYTRAVAMAAPVGLTTCFILLIAISGRGSPLKARIRRVALSIAALAGLIPIAFLKAEAVQAPFEKRIAADADTVKDWIASGDDVAQFRAWARLQTMSRDERDVVARSLTDLLVSDDPAARESAELTLRLALRRHTLVTLIEMVPSLEQHLANQVAQGRAAGEPPQVQRAATFAREFVQSSLSPIRKALDPRNRDNLPEGGLEALFVALATDDVIGHRFLVGFAEHGDETLKPLATEMLDKLGKRS